MRSNGMLRLFSPYKHSWDQTELQIVMVELQTGENERKY